MRSPKTVLSAQVVLRAASGKRPGGTTAATAANIRDYVPSSDAVAAATQAFGKLGFDVGTFAGTSFSITAPAKTFEKVFGSRVRRKESQEAEAVGAGTGSRELPTAALPKELRELVETVTFGRAPDFGPGQY